MMFIIKGCGPLALILSHVFFYYFLFLISLNYILNYTLYTVVTIHMIYHSNHTKQNSDGFFSRLFGVYIEKEIVEKFTYNEIINMCDF
jgi:hypothetical protein